MKPKYMAHSVYVISKNDVDEHFISERKLVELYSIFIRKTVGYGQYTSDFISYKDMPN